MKELKLKAMAKINLGLDALRKREDGYHDLRMIMQSIYLYDRIFLKITKKPEIAVSTNLSYLPANENNLAYKAAKLLIDEFEIRSGVKIEIQKYIPVAAGMAGGSTDAAAVLFGMNKLLKLGLSKEELMARGVKLGADVPYCLRGGTMLAEGIGEKLTQLADMPHCYVVLCKPPFAVSTKEVYQEIDSVPLTQRPDTEGMKQALENGDYQGVCGRLMNVMETVTATKRHQIGEIRAVLRENGADATLMSGSGPTVYGLFSDRNTADAAATVLARRFSETFLTETVQ